MKLEEYKLVFIAVGLIGILLIATPAVAKIISMPVSEQFSELFLLGPEHMAENYPSNIVIGQNYSVYIGAGNHMGASSYYTLYVKLLNQTDVLPNATSQIPNPSVPLYEYRFSMPNGNYWEGPLSFSVNDASISGNQSIINRFTVNGFSFKVNKPGALDSNSTKFSYEFVFELWLYDLTSNSFQYNNRFVDLHLNLTSNN
jgi:hypothetical protein